MNYMKTTTLAVLIGIGMTAVANAEVTVDVNVWPVKDVEGVALPDGSLWMLILDKDRDGFEGWDFAAEPMTDNTSANTEDFAFDTDDMVIAQGATRSYFGQSPGEVKTDPAAKLDLNPDEDIDTGDPVYLFWFAGLPEDAPAPGVGTQFGVMQVTELPGDTGTATPDGLVNFNSDFRAQYITVPEPASIVLAMAGGAALISARRRRQA